MHYIIRSLNWQGWFNQHNNKLKLAFENLSLMLCNEDEFDLYEIIITSNCFQ